MTALVSTLIKDIQFFSLPVKPVTVTVRVTVPVTVTVTDCDSDSDSVSQFFQLQLGFMMAQNDCAGEYTN